MRTLLILWGNYHCGQTEFIAQNSLQDFTLDINDLRFMALRKERLASDFYSLDYQNDAQFYKILFYFLELRMKKGEFCVLNFYYFELKKIMELCKFYRYEIYIINFNQKISKALENSSLNALKTRLLTPENLIKKTAQKLKNLPKKIKILSPNEWQKCLYEMPDLSKFKKIHHIGDIQGCYSVLKDYLKNIKDDEFYIFLGDYIDRGIENGKVMKFLLELCKKKNVIFLEGNHERHLINWANSRASDSKEFNENTLKDFRKEKFTKKNAKVFYPKLKECFFYSYEKKHVFCSHGGVNYLPQSPQELSFMTSRNFIYGIGDYNESKQIAEQFCKNTPKDFYQIFGHRNRSKLPIKIASRAFLCEGKVDLGGFLRIVVLGKKGFECVEIKNEIFRKK